MLAPSFLMLQVDRTRFEVEIHIAEKRCGRVVLDPQIYLDVDQERKTYKLAAAACHTGRVTNGGHWTTWRRGETVGVDMEWVVDDDEHRRLPLPQEDVEEQAALAFYVREDAWPWSTSSR